MTFTDLEARVQDRLNLTSAASLARIGKSINECYRWVASDCGISTIEFVPGVTATTTINVRSLTFGPTPTPVEKIRALYNSAYTPPLIMSQVTFDTIRNEPILTDPPTEWAIQTTGAKSITVFLNSAVSTAFTLTADVDSNLSDLSGTQVPAFAEDFHNLLIYGAMAIELEKLEKYDMAAVQQAKFEKRLGELKFYIVKSGYLDIVQGINNDLAITRSVPLV